MITARVTTPPPSTAEYATRVNPVGHITTPPAEAVMVCWSAKDVATIDQNGMITSSTEMASTTALAAWLRGCGFSIHTGRLLARLLAALRRPTDCSSVVTSRTP